MTIETARDWWIVISIAALLVVICLFIVDVIRDFFTGSRIRKLKQERDNFWEMLNDYRDESGRLLPASTFLPDSEAGPCDMRVRKKPANTGHTDCGRMGQATPIRGNPDLKTCALEQLMMEMGNRSVSCIGVCYAEYLLPDGRVGRHPHIFYSGDPMMQLGLVDMLREFVRIDHVGDIIEYHENQKGDDNEQPNGVPKE